MTRRAVHASELASGRINTGPLLVHSFGDPTTRGFIANHVAHVAHEKHSVFCIHTVHATAVGRNVSLGESQEIAGKGYSYDSEASSWH